MFKPWIIGDWAAEAERAEEEEKARAEAAAALADSANDSATPDEASSKRADSFSGKSRKKKQTFSISEFTTGRSVSHGTRTRDTTNSRGILPAQGITVLPTGPRVRSCEDDQRGGGYYGGASDRLGGGRGTYDGGRLGNDRKFSRSLHERDPIEPFRADGSSDWSSSKRTSIPHASRYGGESKPLPDDEKRVPHQRQHAELPPSPADGVDNWGSGKKSLFLAPTESQSARRNDGGRQISRADEADNWTMSKHNILPPVAKVYAQSRADEAANWKSTKTLSMSLHNPESRAVGDWGRTTQQKISEDLWRRPVVLMPKIQHRISSPPKMMNADVPTNALPPFGPKPRPNPFGAARPQGEIVASQGLYDHRRIGTEEGESRPSSSYSSRPSMSGFSGDKYKMNPFGNKQLREVFLQEGGKDWCKMNFNLEHHAVDRTEADVKIDLKEVWITKQKMCSQMEEELHFNEMQLQDLTMALDEKVRFRTGSQAGCSDIARRSEMFKQSGSDWRPSGTGIGRNHDSAERLESSRIFDASDQTCLSSEYGPSSRSRQQLAANLGESTRACNRMGSWSGRRHFEPSERPDWRSGLPELDAADKHAGGPDVWTRPMGWRGQERRSHYKGGARRL